MMNPAITFYAVALSLIALGDGCSWGPNAISPSPSRDSGTTTNPGEATQEPGGAGPNDGSLERSARDEIRDASDSERSTATGPIIGTPLSTFDSNANGFTLNMFAEATNLALGTAAATLTWIASDGSPDPGCLKITAPYSGFQAQGRLPGLQDFNGHAPQVRWGLRTQDQGGGKHAEQNGSVHRTSGVTGGDPWTDAPGGAKKKDLKRWATIFPGVKAVRGAGYGHC